MIVRRGGKDHDSLRLAAQTLLYLGGEASPCLPRVDDVSGGCRGFHFDAPRLTKPDGFTMSVGVRQTVPASQGSPNGSRMQADPAPPGIVSLGELPPGMTFWFLRGYPTPNRTGSSAVPAG